MIDVRVTQLETRAAAARAQAVLAQERSEARASGSMTRRRHRPLWRLTRRVTLEPGSCEA